MAIRRYHRPSKPRIYRKNSRWFYIIFIIIVAGISLYFWGPWGKKEDTNTGYVREKAIEFIKNEPKPEPIMKKETSEVIADLEAYLADKQGTYGYTVIELDDGRQYGKRDATYYTAASSIKVAIFAYLYHQIKAGAISEDKVLTYTSSDYEGGTGSLQADPVGSKYKVAYLAERMIKVSDNVATNILVRTLGRTNIQNYLNSVGLADVKMATNDVTPRGMAKLLRKIYDGEILRSENKELLMGYMKNSITPERLVAGVPVDIEVAHKIGSWSGAMSDIGIVFANNRAYAIAVYSSGVAWGAATDTVIAGISKKVYNFEKSF